MKGIGLVFAGGGGKGAYEVGVWKYLHEIGWNRFVKCVSGTSVGALNAALFVGSTYECAEDLWFNIEQEKIMSPRKISDIIAELGAHAVENIPSLLILNSMPLPLYTMLPLMTVTDIVDLVRLMSGTRKINKRILEEIEEKYLSSKRIEKYCLCSRDGIREMISNGLNFHQLQTSEVSCYATCWNCEKWKVERFRLNDYSQEEITTLLLASSAIPLFFSNEKFNGDIYVDGGVVHGWFGDNIPIDPVYDAGVEYLVVVHFSGKSVIDRSKYPGVKIIEIFPECKWGLDSTLDFSPEGAKKRWKLGYEDARAVITNL